MAERKRFSLLLNILLLLTLTTSRVCAFTLFRSSISKAEGQHDTYGSKSLHVCRWRGTSKYAKISSSSAMPNKPQANSPRKPSVVVSKLMRLLQIRSRAKAVAGTPVSVADSGNSKKSTKRTAWTKEEDDHLLSLVDVAGENKWGWKVIADKLSKAGGPNKRSIASCMTKYRKLMPDKGKRKHMLSDRLWSKEERVIEAAPRPLNWKSIVAHFPHRGVTACKMQYHSNMKDVADIRGRSTAWSAYEKAVLSYLGSAFSISGMVRKFLEHGGQDLLPGRSYNAIIGYSKINSERSIAGMSDVSTGYELSEEDKRKIDVLMAKIKGMSCRRSKLFSEEQDEIIKQQVMSTSSYNETTQRNNVQGVGWKRIAGLLGNSFTAEQCKERWMSALDPSIIREDFSAEEDTLLLQLQKELKGKWIEISERMGGKRTRLQCHSRWLQINPALKKGPWTAEEKQQLSLIMTSLLQYQNGSIASLAEVVERLTTVISGTAAAGSKLEVVDEELQKKIKKGKTYVVAGELLRRSQRDCQAIWTQELDPSKKRGSMSKEEIALVLQGIYVYGEDYARIASKFLPDRICRDIAGRWRAMKSKVENLVLGQDQTSKKQLKAMPRLQVRSKKNCQNLWIQELDPSKERGSIMKEEIALVLQGIYVYGEDYARIAAEYLPDRISEEVAARWTNMKSKVENLVLGHDQTNKKQLKAMQPAGYKFVSYLQAKPDLLSSTYFDQLAEGVMYYHKVNEDSTV